MTIFNFCFLVLFCKCTLFCTTNKTMGNFFLDHIYLHWTSIRSFCTERMGYQQYLVWAIIMVHSSRAISIPKQSSNQISRTLNLSKKSFTSVDETLAAILSEETPLIVLPELISSQLIHD